MEVISIKEYVGVRLDSDTIEALEVLTAKHNMYSSRETNKSGMLRMVIDIGVQEMQRRQKKYETANGVQIDIDDILKSQKKKKNAKTVKKEYESVGRNNPCPCGSGKKYKLCHGK